MSLGSSGVAAPEAGAAGSAAELGSNRAPRDGEVYLIENFLPASEAEQLFDAFLDELSWQPETIVIAGKPVPVPRLVCWYGDDQACYRYSGVSHRPLPWTPHLRGLRGQVAQAAGCELNSVLGNYYRTGSDSMGWHADKERELGADPAIVSLSLGSPRRFLIRHNRTRQTLTFDLGAGSLLIMAGSLQHHWRHCLPKQPGPVGARINLTFRKIIIR
jgi:alkylated DNA repair dioxygenase AlkB